MRLKYLRSLSDGLPFSKEENNADEIVKWNGNTDFGIPIYISLLLPDTKFSEPFLVTMPFYTTGDYITETLVGIGTQVNMGVKINNIVMETAVSTAGKQGITLQAGIAYKF